MRPEQMKLGDLPKHVQERIIKDNPDVFRPVETSQPKPRAIPTLASCTPKQKQRKSCVEVLVGFTACLQREMDSDNLVSSIKPLRDAICEDLGIDDGDKRIMFEYSQQQTKGCEGVIVKVEI